VISQQSLEKFKKLYEKRFKEKISDQEALKRATRILNIYRLLYGPKSYGSINPRSNKQTTQSNYYGN